MKKYTPTMVEINYWTNGKIGAKVAFPRYTESVKFNYNHRQKLLEQLRKTVLFRYAQAM